MSQPNPTYKAPAKLREELKRLRDLHQATGTSPLPGHTPDGSNADNTAADMIDQFDDEIAEMERQISEAQKNK
jgi:hypothetical protein